MKIITFLLFVCCLQAAVKGHAQNVTLNLENVPVQKVFTELSRQTGISIVFSEAQLNGLAPVSIKVKDATIQEVLTLCLKNQPLSYKMEDGLIVISKNSTGVSQAPVNFPPLDISVRVTNAQSEPLVGASVILKRTDKGYIADVSGRVKINNVQPDDVLEISNVGYKTQNIKIGDQINFSVALEVALNELDRVQIQAYGKTSRRITTGNIVTVTAEEIERQPVMNPLLALQGRIPGLEVRQLNGFASAPIKVELRGRGSIGIDPFTNFVSDPLYIIDGVPLTVLDVAGQSSYIAGSAGFLQSGSKGPAGGQSPLFSINPSDIESMEVLKDADATAIYGSRGANGVILITTKKGKAGKTKFDLHVQQGVTRVTRVWDMLSTPDYLSMRREAFKNDNIAMTAGNAYDLLLWDTTRYTNWQKQVFGGVGKVIDVQGNVSGGDNRTNFRLGTGYNRTTNILTVSGADQRASVSLNFSHASLSQKFQLSVTGTYSYTQSDMVYFPGKPTYAPNAPDIYDSAGNLNYAGWGGQNSAARSAFPFSNLKRPYFSATNFLNSNIVLNYQPTRGLSLRTSLGYSNAQANQQDLQTIASKDPLTNPTGNNSFGYNSNKNLIIEPQMDYNAIIGKGKFNVLFGGSFQQTNTDASRIDGSGYTSDLLIKSITSAPVRNAYDNHGVYKYAAVFGRISYNLKNRYIINLNARRDGSSRFGKGKQYGNFGSVGAAWIFTEEGFFEKKRILSFGKIRASYGTTGSDAVGDYGYLTRWSGTQTYNGIAAMEPLQHANPEFQWQVNKKLEAAIDLGFLDDRININATYYRNRVGNQLVQFPTPAFSGFTTVIANSSAFVQNDGWEFSTSTRIIQTKDFSWSLTFNIGINRNKLLAYPDIELSPFASTLEVGKSLNIVKLLHFTGVDPMTGQYTFEDKNKDGVINITATSPANDFYDYDISPKYLGALGSITNYKQFQLGLFFTIKKQIGVNAINQGNYPGTVNNIQPVGVLNRWQKPGDITSVARFTTIGGQASDLKFKTYSDGGYTDASFMRLSNLSASYDLPNSWIKKTGIKGCRLFFHANNLFIITNYKGIDPETQNFGSMPPTKTIVGGLDLNF